ncbi:hypothetical protein Q4E40_19460 [Pontibacter sp. BT731]|uniref:hypothetical protein n=1 Tax=Pontibacter coccineus TaxID=3063328 RepID=UPI0026E3D2C3|nr:hypothetical protein [Pontibacter sp. BT731]MDO6392321.1 hypothetical protein [Pontibacter sp. BT731]
MMYDTTRRNSVFRHYCGFRGVQSTRASGVRICGWWVRDKGPARRYSRKLPGRTRPQQNRMRPNGLITIA